MNVSHNFPNGTKTIMNAVLDRVNSFYRSIYLMGLLCVIAASFIAYQIVNFNEIKGLAVVLILIFSLSLLRIDWAIFLFIFLSPFHYVFKEIYSSVAVDLSSVAVDLWREGFFFCILGSWFLQVFLKNLRLPYKNILNALIIAYILWGAIEILNSIDLLVGLAGFRFMFAFVPLYFVALSTIKGEKEIKKYVNVILISGFIIAVMGIIQFVLFQILGIVEHGIFLDFTRKYGGATAAGISFQRATSVLRNPNELGNFLFTCLAFIFALNYYSPEYRRRHHKNMIFSMIIMLVALLLTMSRSSIISFLCSILAISFFQKGKRRLKIIMGAVLGIVILALILPFSLKVLFEPLYTFSDPYYAGLGLQYFWDIFWQSPMMGNGFSVTASTAEKLGITQLGVTGVGSTDNYFLQTSMQIGVIGFFLHFLIWFLFLRNSYLAAKNIFLSETYKSVSIAIFGILIGLMIASLHTSPWEYVSLSGTYYIMGAIAVFIYHRGKSVKDKMKGDLTG